MQEGGGGGGGRYRITVYPLRGEDRQDIIRGLKRGFLIGFYVDLFAVFVMWMLA